ncbi:MAG: TonB-dependent receptor [Bacteroidetes bacterium]|nr:TonB-dependent receptor [Bacteroidota bacterium]
MNALRGSLMRGGRVAGLLSTLLFVSVLLWAGTTGKIAGSITDALTGEALVGANVMLVGTSLGTTTDLDGYYTINNIPPGVYQVVVSYVGYRRTTVTNVQVRIDQTTRVDAKLQSEAIEGEEVIVRAERPLVQKDLTSSSVTLSADDLKRIPTENLSQVVNIQAGVVGGHFRGGRSNEVAYLIDGVSVVDPFNGRMSVEVDNTTIREMEVISGTFNAEYGQAMSGVVNIVTQEGASDFHGSLSLYAGDYVTSNDGTYMNLAKIEPFRTANIQGSLSGPIAGGLSFFGSLRSYQDEGYLYGRRLFLTSDRSPYALRDPLGNSILGPDGQAIYVIPQSGDGAYVSMNPSKRNTANGKLSYSMGYLKFSGSLLWEDHWNKYYDHGFSRTPDGTTNHYRTNWVSSFQVTHSPTANTYQTFKASYNQFDYKGYVYENELDPRYVDPSQGTPISNYTFRSGGQASDRYDRHTRTWIGQWALSSQLDAHHKVGVGIEGRRHEIYNHWKTILNRNTVVTDSSGALVFEIGYPDVGTSDHTLYYKEPYEFSAYVQDKIEYDIMIINAGVRVDYFNPNASYPLDLRNPSGNPEFPNAGVSKKTSAKVQVSPRLGVSFPITDEGIIHFSYGHFFQIPSFENLYLNSNYLVNQGDNLSSVIGNPDLEAQRTVMYELGLQQVLFGQVGIDFTIYYRDIRNLLGMEILSTYEGFRFSRFINRDYANVKGFIFSVERRFIGGFSVRADYTYQIAEGNASDPYAVFYNNQSDPPTETNKKVVPLDWDQRSTLNVSVSVGDPGDWNVGLIAQYGNGFPYTEDVRVSNGLRFENGGKRPTTFNVDLRAEKTVAFGPVDLTVFALVYNLLDTRNEYGVNAASGRANIDLYTYLAGRIIGLNTIDEYVNNPASFSAPRQVRLGVTWNF